ncbi:MAG: YlxR family protein [Anaerolineales bacterium]|nr:YlxR family protein [Anaerolineales bacterium]NUQ83982.1 YlxR family protein [Anaerolineales bacterium]
MKVSKKKPVQRVKHVPQRTCVGCREVLPKRTMIRIVRTAEGVRMDPTGKLAGRGAYLHDRRECWERGLKGALAHALKTTIRPDERAMLENFMNTLPQEAIIGETL